MIHNLKYLKPSKDTCGVGPKHHTKSNQEDYYCENLNHVKKVWKTFLVDRMNIMIENIYLK